MTNQQPMNNFQPLNQNSGGDGADGNEKGGGDELSTTDVVFAVVIAGAAVSMLGLFWMFGDSMTDTPADERQRTSYEHQATPEDLEREFDSYREGQAQRSFQGTRPNVDQRAVERDTERMRSQAEALERNPDMSPEEMQRQQMFRNVPESDGRAAFEEQMRSAQQPGYDPTDAVRSPEEVMGDVPDDTRRRVEQEFGRDLDEVQQTYEQRLPRGYQ